MRCSIPDNAFKKGSPSDPSCIEPIIRQYHPHDEEAVYKVNQASLEISFRFYYNHFHKREPELFLVAEFNQEIIGFILVKTGHHFQKGLSAIIFAIAVSPQYRCSTVGRQLVNTIIKILQEKEIDKLYLHVRVGNPRGIKFYERLGFTKIKRVEGFYSWGEAAYRMLKHL